MSEAVLPKKTILPKISIPLIDVSLPEISLPEFPPKPPRLDDRQMEIVRYAAMDDISDIVPVVGDVFSDIAYAEIKKKMTPEEYERFLEANKVLPSSLAAIKVFYETKE
jgi:acetoacetate decarboxylase